MRITSIFRGAEDEDTHDSMVARLSRPLYFVAGDRARLWEGPQHHLDGHYARKLFGRHYIVLPARDPEHAVTQARLFWAREHSSQAWLEAFAERYRQGTMIFKPFAWPPEIDAIDPYSLVGFWGIDEPTARIPLAGELEAMVAAERAQEQEEARRRVANDAQFALRSVIERKIEQLERELADRRRQLAELDGQDAQRARWLSSATPTRRLRSGSTRTSSRAPSPTRKPSRGLPRRSAGRPMRRPSWALNL